MAFSVEHGKNVEHAFGLLGDVNVALGANVS